ncbi:uncharacterized protein A4U43_C06F4050 [Asparagus officinalis]|uniref:non-specific serine/threonine protein kinase n=1 Tax=Asparagus officinalis TaxID=4686 RepID=A0A5P1EPX3_ASPOF|nr:serine/threonine-protein kinase RIPK-like [Asparagus officinalis]ONK66090.1 uncharacterized protein A4U43_C06F4050 [Asparagus officinalis]
MGKLSLGSLLTSCFIHKGINTHPQPRRSSATRVSDHGSPDQRLSCHDISSPEDLSLSSIGSNLYIFSLDELKKATRSFSLCNLIGEGGFGPVYKGFVDERIRPGVKAQAVAVKLLDLEGVQGQKEWMTEVIFLGQLRHPNLVKLIGYCYEKEHRLLVYEFMEKGSLENHLFKRLLGPLPWTTRLQIAVGAAKGLAFLHEAEKPVIYRDFKASNILLDKDFKTKLSDFGLAKDGPEGDASHVSTRVMGTEGYCAPEYIMTGHLTAKSDVYSFGVVLLELLTGQRSVDKTRPNREQNLVTWAKPFLKNPDKLNYIMDSSLDGQYSTLGAQRAAALAHKCLSHSQKSRPLMRTVVETLEPLLELDDIPMGTFVYNVMDDNGGENEDTDADANANANAKQNGVNNHDERHKSRFPNSSIHRATSLKRKDQRRNRRSE